MGFTTKGRRPQRYQTEINGGFEFPAVLTGTRQLDDRSSNVQMLDGGLVDRQVRMPASNREGVPFTIINTGATNLLLLRDSDGDPIVAGTTQLAPTERAVCVRIGGSWRHLGIDSLDSF